MSRAKSQWVLVLLALLTIVSAVWFFVEYRNYSVHRRNFDTVQSQLLLLQEQLARAQAKPKNTTTAPATAQVTPKGANESSLMREIGNAVAKSGAKLQTVTFSSSTTGNSNPTSGGTGQVSAPAGTQPLYADIQATGSTAQLLEFVNLIQTSDRLSVLRSFTMNAGQNGQTLEVQFNFPYLS
ncbi:hypothetical protein GCM10025857_32280 [Alicyclobacillus contaminans]|uniref:hypothetical protein n=1 Tax=Alicyclobacillus contaminans TaxID=392016 RepID=UPI00047A5EA5|nr:hypothetical protein [Alicyclobacillus contaminans]GMA51871.1 hypothetical protein GCM10025857_32280 [Alicyclobacillus contaminans]